MVAPVWLSSFERVEPRRVEPPRDGRGALQDSPGSLRLSALRPDEPKSVRHRPSSSWPDDADAEPNKSRAQVAAPGSRRSLPDVVQDAEADGRTSHFLPKGLGDGASAPRAPSSWQKQAASYDQAALFEERARPRAARFGLAYAAAPLPPMSSTRGAVIQKPGAPFGPTPLSSGARPSEVEDTEVDHPVSVSRSGGRPGRGLLRRGFLSV
ncbi:MAG: hypothetical protein IPK13_13320 [Deltaproteobacteria bacterium]|nr:hypothetical protein [Deltaproteobacteria bacterium]